MQLVVSMNLLLVLFGLQLLEAGMSFASTDACSGSVYTTKAPTNITSPNYPENYPPSSHCQWLITSPNGTQITVRLHSCDFDEPSDFVEIYDGSGEDDRVLLTKQSQRCPAIVNSTSNKVYITFTSDARDENNGFVADVSSHTIALMEETEKMEETENTTTGNEGNNKTTVDLMPVVIGLSVAVGVLLIVGVVGPVIYCRCRRSQFKYGENPTMVDLTSLKKPSNPCNTNDGRGECSTEEHQYQTSPVASQIQTNRCTTDAENSPETDTATDQNYENIALYENVVNDDNIYCNA